MLALGDALDQHRQLRPSDWYEPHSLAPVRQNTAEQSCRVGRASGQLQGHQSQHIIRLAAPGNGWGGTTWMGAEVDAWVTHSKRWAETPDWPVRIVWFCPQYMQFDLIRANLEQDCFTRPYEFTSKGIAGHRYIFPDESTVYLGSYDRGWKYYQGIEIDLICFDEQPPLNLWREMRMRRRGMRKTRYMCKATQTIGLSWMASEFYEPWRKFHVEHGLDEDGAMDQQLHPSIWCWPKGGIHDNPAMSDEDCRWYEQQEWSSPKERQVRLFGGFRSWVGDPVFDVNAIDAMLKRAKRFNARNDVQQGRFVVGATCSASSSQAARQST